MKHNAFRMMAVAAMLLASSAAWCDQGLSSASLRSSEAVTVGALSVLVAPAASVAGVSGPGTNVTLGSQVAAMGSGFVVVGISGIARDTVEVILQAASSTGKLSVTLASKTVNTIGLSVGTTVEVVSQATGTLLVASGKVLAFVPNAIGEALLAQNRLPAN